MKKEPIPAARFDELHENIVLIGMFGSGKSTVGKALAEKLRYHFVDVDLLIEGKYRMSLQRVLDRLGMKKFMQMEDRVLRILQYRRCVIAPGGSAVYYPQAMAHLGRLGTRVYLKTPVGLLKKRLPDWSNRGVVRRKGNTLPALYRERAPLFRKYADLTVDTARKSLDKVVDEILEKLQDS